MSFPGYSAETSLYTSRTCYAEGGPTPPHAAQPQVAPQLDCSTSCALSWQACNVACALSSGGIGLPICLAACGVQFGFCLDRCPSEGGGGGGGGGGGTGSSGSGRKCCEWDEERNRCRISVPRNAQCP